MVPLVGGKPTTIPIAGGTDLGDLGTDWGGEGTGDTNLEPTDPTDRSGVNWSEEGMKTRRGRLLITNAVRLVSNTTYRIHTIIRRTVATGQGMPLIVKLRSSVLGIPTSTATITGTASKEIVWTFSTAGVSQTSLDSVRFQIFAYEEFTSGLESATIYVSDINLLGKIAETPVNTIYRYGGEVWDDSIAKISDDGGIVNGHPFGLFEYYESISSAYRLYCISDGIPYVWSTGPQDPYGVTGQPRIVIAW